MKSVKSRLVPDELVWNRKDGQAPNVLSTQLWDSAVLERVCRRAPDAPDYLPLQGYNENITRRQDSRGFLNARCPKDKRVLAPSDRRRCAAVRQALGREIHIVRRSSAPIMVILPTYREDRPLCGGTIMIFRSTAGLGRSHRKRRGEMIVNRHSADRGAPLRSVSPYRGWLSDGQAGEASLETHAQASTASRHRRPVRSRKNRQTRRKQNFAHEDREDLRSLIPSANTPIRSTRKPPS